MLFLINEQKKKTTKGGKGLCRVFLVQNNGYIEAVDITKRIAEIGIGLKYYDGVNLTYHYGSGTGFMRISELIRIHWGNDVVIQDVSIF